MTIHQTAIISSKAQLGKNVSIGPYSIIHDNVSIDDNTIIGAFCEIGIQNHLSNNNNLMIGRNSLIRSHSIFYEGSSFKEGLVTGHRVTVRENTVAGLNLQIGTLSDIQGHCKFGDYTRLHSNVHIGKKSKIGNFVWIFPYVVLTNDPHPPSDTLQGVTVSDYVVIATMSVILPNTKIAKGCLIGAHSSLKGETEAYNIYVGSPAKSKGLTSRIKLDDGSDAYPWTKHFTRGYPQEVIQKWLEQDIKK